MKKNKIKKLFLLKSFIFFSLSLCLFQNASAWIPVGGLTQKRINLVAGATGEEGGVGLSDGVGVNARFNYPTGLAIDNNGNVYITDYENHTIRKITSAGVVSTLAGSAGKSGTVDGTGAAARFYYPSAVAVDSSGNVYVAEESTIRKITPAGVVSTLAGTAGESGSADGTGAAARFDWPQGIAVDSSGHIYVGDTNNNTIRKITPAGVVSTLAGVAGDWGNDDGVDARFDAPRGVAVDSDGNIYVADDYNDSIRKITALGFVTTLAGSSGNTGSTDGAGAAAKFNSPGGVAVDISGNVYVVDTYNHTLRKITAAGVVSTLAGVASSKGADNGTGAAARFNYPYGVTVDSSGNVYVGDAGNDSIRKVTSAGLVTTLAGAYGDRGSTDGVGLSARFNEPNGVAVDSSGNIYVADMGNHTIRKITAAGVVSTLAGAAGSSGSTNGTGAAARFSGPAGVAVDSSGNVYVADKLRDRIQKITPAGVVSTLAGGVLTGFQDGNGAAARFNLPNGVAVDSSGNVYVTDLSNSTIRKITPAGDVSTFAGVAKDPGTVDGGIVGGVSAARLNRPHGVAVDSSDNVYVADTFNHTIRKITPAGVVSTIAGAAGDSGSADGDATTEARFDSPTAVAVDSSGNLFVTDSNNQTIRKITSAGVVSTLAGAVGTDNTHTDGTGAVARFAYPSGVAVDNSGNLYIADKYNYAIRKITSVGVVSTLAGAKPTKHGSTDALGSVARFNNPSGVTADSSGNLYIADSNNRTIRKISFTGVVTTLAGKAGHWGDADGTGTAAGFGKPSGVAVDNSGNVYVADADNSTIRKITSAGVVTTFAGTSGASGSVDGAGSAAEFGSPSAIAVDSSGNLYVADTSNHTIRKITSGGLVSTFAGTAGSAGSTDGASALFDEPKGVAIDKNGNIYVADTNNHTIRKITSAGVVSTLAGSVGLSGFQDGTGASARFNNPNSVTVDGSGNVYVADTFNNMIRKITPVGVVSSIAGSHQSPQVKLGAQPGYIFQPTSLFYKNGRIYFTSGHAVLSLPAP